MRLDLVTKAKADSGVDSSDADMICLDDLIGGSSSPIELALPGILVLEEATRTSTAAANKFGLDLDGITAPPFIWRQAVAAWTRDIILFVVHRSSRQESCDDGLR